MREGRSTFSRLAGCLRRRLFFGTRRLRGDKRGTTAIEFAIVAPAVIGIIITIAENGVFLLAQHVLDTAVQDASRKILTGETQNSGFSAAQFKTDVCSRVSSLMNCSNGVYLDVRNYQNNPAPYPTKPIDSSNVFDPSGFTYDPGGPNCIIVVRAAIAYRGFTPLPIPGSIPPPPELASGQHLLMSTASFRNEPYVNTSGRPSC